MARAQSGADDTGRRVMEKAARLGAEEEAGRGGAEDAALPGAGKEGRTDGAALEQPASQTEEGGSGPRPTEVRGEEAATEATEQMVPTGETPETAAPEWLEGSGVVAPNAMLDEAGTVALLRLLPRVASGPDRPSSPARG